MKIVQPDVEIMLPEEISGVDILRHIERCGRVCYKSEWQITDDSYIPFIRKLIERGHEAVLEHYSVSVKFVCDRGVSHEIVRHRIASYCQESTRYCNYQKDKFGSEICVIDPIFLSPQSEAYKAWENACLTAEKRYFDLLDIGCTPQEARSVLPNSLKTEVVMTANLREWRHFFKLRCSPVAHPQMREVAKMALEQMKSRVPIVFEDLNFS